MHASTIEAHQTLQGQARGIALAWRGTDPMPTSHVGDALRALDPYLSEEGYTELIPYLVDACREEGLIATAMSQASDELGEEEADRRAAEIAHHDRSMDETYP